MTGMTMTDVARCPACGQPIDYCQGHGTLGDPAGAYLLALHDRDDHDDCHPDAWAECGKPERAEA